MIAAMWESSGDVVQIKFTLSAMKYATIISTLKQCEFSFRFSTGLSPEFISIFLFICSLAVKIRCVRHAYQMGGMCSQILGVVAFMAEDFCGAPIPFDPNTDPSPTLTR